MDSAISIFAIDPGPVRSAYIIIGASGAPVERGHVLNNDLVQRLRERASRVGRPDVVVEMIASYGMAVGAEVFETCVWIGRFLHQAEAQGFPAYRLPRLDVKMHLCHRSNATDANVRQALVDRYGGREQAISGRRCAACKGRGKVGLGKKRGPCTSCVGTGWAVLQGPLLGISGDVWAALAVGCAHLDGVRWKP